jgi:hypothetical protein
MKTMVYGNEGGGGNSPHPTIDRGSVARLAVVLTVKEVMYIWGKGRTTVMMAIYKEKIVARQSAVGKTWLVDAASCLKYWGEFTNTLNLWGGNDGDE